MDQLRRTAVVAILLTMAAAATACTSSPAPTPTATTSATPTSAPTASATPPTELGALYMDDAPLLGKLDSVRGTAEVGPFSSTTGRIFLYVRCFGESSLSIDVVGATVFEQACLTDPEDPGTLNRIDVSSLDDVVVRGSAENSNLWAIAVTEAPAD